MTRIRTISPRHLRDFEGVWRIDRDVLHGTGARAHMAGHAEFAPDGDGLAYREEGQMRIDGGPPLCAVRRHVWRPGLEVWFDDGRFFHRVPPSGGTATHRCDPDDYRVIYDFSRWPDWTTQWIVTGPRKDYSMTTRYRPLKSPR